VQGAAAAALGVTRGTVKGDIVVHQGQVYVIELAARLSGGFFCTREIPLNTGVDFIGSAIRVALGENPTAAELTPKYQKPICQRYIIPGAGKVVAISGADEARTILGVLEVNVTAKIGDVIPPAGDKRPSATMVIATGEDPRRCPARRQMRDFHHPDHRAMTAPYAASAFTAGAGTLNLFAFFPSQSRLFLDRRGTAGRGDRTLLHAAAPLGGKFGPIGIEASGFTLEEIALRRPDWIDDLKRLITAAKWNSSAAATAR
jgi:hypothetical protein